MQYATKQSCNFQRFSCGYPSAGAGAECTYIVILALYRLCSCLLYHLFPFASCNLLRFSCIYLPFLCTSSFTLSITPLRFQARCHRRRLSLCYSLPQFMSLLYFCVSLLLLVIGLVLCYPRLLYCFFSWL